MLHLLLNSTITAALTYKSSDSLNPSSQRTIAGNWRLVSVNGFALPFAVVVRGTDSVLVVSSRVSFTTDGRWTAVDSNALGSTSGRVFFPATTNGTWVQDRSGVTMHDLVNGGTRTVPYAGGGELHVQSASESTAPNLDMKYTRQ